MRIKASLPPDVPQPYSGELIQALESAVAAASGQTGESKLKSGPALIYKQDGRNYFRLTELPPQAEIHCSTADCDNQARLLLDSRDQEVLPFCKCCAHVEFAMWMVGA